MLVTPSPRSDTAGYLETLASSLEQGVECVQLHAPELTLPDYTSLTRKVIALCHRYAARIILNTEPQLAQARGLDYIILGPVQTTTSHSHTATLGWDGFARLVTLSVMPVYAIGGMQPGQLDKVRSLGGHGIAAMSSLWGYSPPES